MPHRPSQRLHRARRSTDGLGHEDVHITVVPSKDEPRVATAKVSGRSAALNPRIPEALR